MKLSISVCLACLVCLVCPAFSYDFPAPSFSGASGLVRIPDATVVPYKNWNIGSDYGTQTINNEQRPAFNYKANLGTFHNFELGLVGGLDRNAQEIREGVFVNMKYSPAIGDGSDPLLLAIGVENLASHTDAGVYMVATKPFRQGPALSFGFMADFPGNKFRPLGMAGLDIPLGTLSIMQDLFAGESVFQYNAGIRMRFTPTFSLDARAINLFGDDSQNNTKDRKFFLFGMAWANPF